MTTYWQSLDPPTVSFCCDVDDPSMFSIQVKASQSDGRFSSFFDGASNFGLVEARYEDNFTGGNTPHLWTGSVQIIEEFLKGGATPVKYGQCWVISALMTSRKCSRSIITIFISYFKISYEKIF